MSAISVRKLALSLSALSLLLSSQAAGTPALEKTKEIGAGDFPKGLQYVCVDSSDNIYGGGGASVVMYSPDGAKKAEWTSLPIAVSAVAVDSVKGLVYAGGTDASGCKILQLEVKDGKTSVLGNFPTPVKMNAITAMKFSKGFVYAADAKAAAIYKFAVGEKGLKESDALGVSKAKERLISTCCGILCFDIDSKGDVVVANLGQHRVTVLNSQGTAYKSAWGKAGKGPEDFCGCCNPVCLAVASDGSIVTAEKTIPRLKLYSPDGKKLLGITGGSDFNKSCSDLIVDVNSKKTVYAVDGQSGVIKVFSLAAEEAGAGKKPSAPLSQAK